MPAYLRQYNIDAKRSTHPLSLEKIEVVNMSSKKVFADGMPRSSSVCIQDKYMHLEKFVDTSKYIWTWTYINWFGVGYMDE